MYQAICEQENCENKGFIFTIDSDINEFCVCGPCGIEITNKKRIALLEDK
jgi:hypothetical protein